ncbi:MAG: MunI family type II restriction endonuclease [Alphaproteobacteria bacterium]|nr:MunI family type II restriction endonuclease [Alphaproteobacteria bacterium]MDA7982924.1 MunI family type II restriction endonuclease [Alphaproteobacteria bacterium]MDA7988514.1 MunI family type II restriction endonuclease [Alphaproteobacteria bacterium]MDA8008863.1 MunI family type II restriction endonuclease [Alphaproteobacteria bacterium]MDA8031296.1 MunI family type II restriction endonuclease [Alphaproteobacteria bacterium]
MREALSARDNWQQEAADRGDEPEAIVYHIFERYFRDSPYEITRRPKDLKGIYGNDRGIQPDHSIKNLRTERTVFLEVKRQRARGNAHERACKYFTPGIVHAGRQAGNLGDDVFPFWLIFTNGIATDERYVREISFWFGEQRKDALTLWRDLAEKEPLITHFERYIVPKLGGAKRASSAP